MAQDMAKILADAKNSPTVRALAAGQDAQDAMGAATGDLDYSDAAGKLAAAFDTILADFLAAYPHLAHAIASHRAH